MKKGLTITLRVVSGLLLVFAVLVLAFTLFAVRSLGKDATVFGFKPYVVTSDSMQDTFRVGDIVISRQTDVSKLQVGDVITFKSIDPAAYGIVITHKISGITTYNGEPAFETYGTTTGNPDEYPVPFDRVLGKYLFRIPKGGYFAQFMRTPQGYLLLVAVPFGLLIALQGVNFIKVFRKYRAEQQQEIDRKKAEIDAERAETERMREELERLRAQVAQQTDAPHTPDQPHGEADRGPDGEPGEQPDGGDALL